MCYHHPSATTSGDVLVSNIGELFLGDAAGINLASFTKDGNFTASAFSPQTVTTDVYTIGTGDINLFATGSDNLTVNSGITINAEAGSVFLSAATGDVVFGSGGWSEITVSGAEYVGIDTLGSITFDEPTHINSLLTELRTGIGPTDVISINNSSTLHLTGTGARLDSGKVTTTAGFGFLVAQLATLDFEGYEMALTRIDFAAVEQTYFINAATTVAANRIDLGETHATGDLTLTGALTLHGPLNAAGKLTIGEYGAANDRNAFANADITANEIDILATSVTGGIFTAATKAAIGATDGVTEATIVANEVALTAALDVAGVEVTALTTATLSGRTMSANVISAGGAVSLTGTGQVVGNTIDANGTATLAGI